MEFAEIGKRKEAASSSSSAGSLCLSASFSPSLHSSLLCRSQLSLTASVVVVVDGDSGFAEIPLLLLLLLPKTVSVYRPASSVLFISFSLSSSLSSGNSNRRHGNLIRATQQIMWVRKKQNTEEIRQNTILKRVSKNLSAFLNLNAHENLQ